MSRVYRKTPVLAKSSPDEFSSAFEDLYREQMSELLQAVLNAEVDVVLGRVRHARRGDGEIVVYRATSRVDNRAFLILLMLISRFVTSRWVDCSMLLGALCEHVC